MIRTADGDVMKQITLFDITERELKYCELPDHIGERLHYRITKDEVVNKDDATDEYVVLVEAYKKSDEWMYSVYRRDDGSTFKWISNPTNDKYGHGTHLFVEAST